MREISALRRTGVIKFTTVFSEKDAPAIGMLGQTQLAAVGRQNRIAFDKPPFGKPGGTGQTGDVLFGEKYVPLPLAARPALLTNK